MRVGFSGKVTFYWQPENQGDSIQANNRGQKVLGSDVCIKKNKITLNVKHENERLF